MKPKSKSRNRALEITEGGRSPGGTKIQKRRLTQGHNLLYPYLSSNIHLLKTYHFPRLVLMAGIQW